MLESDSQKLDGLRTYIDGKLRRYGLLFSVNGGALAIGKLMADANAAALLGGLKVTHVAVGAIIFTVIMVVDIWLFGRMMRRKFLGDLVFSWPGKVILVLLGLLIVAAWALVIYKPRS
ncbi:MAG: hypothetical protein M3362_02650 [Acidobacteriota bacterium]|nr:hypothetical protein [Acidobacteriota bacterium]